RQHRDDRVAADLGPSPGDLALRIERDAVGGGIAPGQPRFPWIFLVGAIGVGLGSGVFTARYPADEPGAAAELLVQALEQPRRAPNGAVFLTDGYINLAILNRKTEKSADVGANGPNYSGIHHFGFEVENLDEAAASLERAAGQRLEEKEGLGMEMAAGGHRNFEMKWAGPDGVVIDISHTGWETKAR